MRFSKVAKRCCQDTRCHHFNCFLLLLLSSLCTEALRSVKDVLSAFVFYCLEAGWTRLCTGEVFGALVFGALVLSALLFSALEAVH